MVAATCGIGRVIGVWLLSSFWATAGASASPENDDWSWHTRPMGRCYLCARAVQAPSIDGRLDEWDLTKAPIQINRQLAPQIGIITNFVRDDADLRAEGCFSWDDQHLYLAFSVDDDVVIEVDRERARSLKPWETDSVMISLQTGEGTAGQASQFLAVAPVQAGVEQPFILPSLGVRCAVLRRPAGYNVEVALPFAGWKATCRPGQLIRLAILIPDGDDDKGTASPLWKQVSWHYPKGVWNLAEFGEVYLSGDDPFLVTLQVGRSTLAPEAEMDILACVSALTEDVRLMSIGLADAAGNTAAARAVGRPCPDGHATTVAGRLSTRGLRPGRYRLVAKVACRGRNTDIPGPAVHIGEAASAPAEPAVALKNDTRRLNSPDQYPGRPELTFKKAEYVRALERIARRAPGSFTKGTWDYPALPALRYLAGGKEADAREAMDAIVAVAPKAGQEEAWRPGWPWTPPLTAAWILRDWPGKTEADRAALKRLFAAWTGYELEHLERGAMNRAFSRGHHLKGFVTLVPDLPRAKELNAIADAIWWDMAAAGDTDESSENYNGHHFLFMLKFAEFRGERPEGEFWSDPAIRRMVGRYRDCLTPLGAPPHYGDGGAWAAEPWIWCPFFEKAASVYRDGTFKWAAHRCLQYSYEHYERFVAWHWLMGSFAECLTLAYLWADDAIEPVAPPAESRVLLRRAIEPADEVQRKMGFFFTVRKRDVPDKLVLRSGWDPGDLYALVGLFPNAGHGDFESPAILTLTGGGAVLLRSADYAEREARTLNSMAIEDLQGLSGPWRRTTVSVPAFQEGRRATYARVLVENYEGLPVVVERELLFLKNSALVVRDRVAFAEAFRCRVGQWWHATAAGPAIGPHWLNLYQKPLAEQYGGFWTHYDQDLLIYGLARPDVALVGTHDTRYRFCFRWEGIGRPGRDLFLSAVLLPHAPTGTLEKEVARIAPHLDDGTAAVVSIRNEDGSMWWVVSNPEGRSIRAVSLETDARAAVVRVDKGRATYCLIHEARHLRLAGQDLLKTDQPVSWDKEVK